MTLCRRKHALWAVVGLMGVLCRPLYGRENGTLIPASVTYHADLCATQKCHGSFPVNSGGAVYLTRFPLLYQPGRTYRLGVVMTGGEAYGLELAAFFKRDKSQAGRLQAVSPGLTVYRKSSVDHLTHQTPLPAGLLEFEWQAPTQPRGTVLFRAAANSANRNGDRDGDRISTAEISLDQAAVEPPPQRTLYLPHWAEGGAGPDSLYATELLLHNPGPDSRLTLEFFDPAGIPLPMSSLEEAAPVQVSTLRQGRTLRISTPGRAGQIRSGYARITTDAPVGLVAILRRFGLWDDRPLVLSEAAVPGVLPAPVWDGLVDSRRSRRAGLALINTGQAVAQVRLDLRDESGNLLGQAGFELAAGQQTARFISEFFLAAGQETLAAIADEMLGSVRLSSEQPLSVVVIRQNDDPRLGYPDEVPTLVLLPALAISASGEP